MPEVFYLNDLSEDARKRHYHKTQRGQLIDFDDLRSLDYKEALALADSDINKNWETYKERFLKGEYP
ncbi:MAG: hypothetical protein A2Z21_03465 [Candidatus Fraserbacteria bacterium RBG_16_55_9]|uniref:DUF7718 domain-containing protein n=1 Tax=Fraserbacteria sp. (strain RBG_16_55_9) TaxID=1817864 RepID=A0A1F5URK8_FRAXR|nr:MAG: hypothetical protein A2Z21_03465 [Candidatus Fraserbacteria bacterium RBG_16_55_9]